LSLMYFITNICPFMKWSFSRVVSFGAHTCSDRLSASLPRHLSKTLKESSR
jgi:hypothetical protein